MFAAIFAVEFGMTFWSPHGPVVAHRAAIGFANGYMVIKSGLPSFIVTLGTFFVLRGFNLWFTQRETGGTNVTGIETVSGTELARKIFAGTMFTIGGASFNVAILWFLILTVIGVVLLRTRVGNWIYAVGGNKDAARMIGVPASATKIGLFMAVAACGWLHGMVAHADETGQRHRGVGQEFYFIIAAVLGGCLLTGGFGSVVGAALGCLILGMTQQGIPLAGWDSNLYFLFLGVILLVAALANEWIRRWGRTAGRPSRPPEPSAAATVTPAAAVEEAAMPDVHLLELDNVSKYFGNIIALQNITTSVNAGEVTCTLGDNGAGKSTFIKILAGVHQHDAGGS